MRKIEKLESDVTAKQSTLEQVGSSSNQATLSLLRGAVSTCQKPPSKQKPPLLTTDIFTLDHTIGSVAKAVLFMGEEEGGGVGGERRRGRRRRRGRKRGWIRICLEEPTICSRFTDSINRTGNYQWERVTYNRGQNYWDDRPFPPPPSSMLQYWGISPVRQPNFVWGRGGIISTSYWIVVSENDWLNL